MRIGGVDIRDMNDKRLLELLGIVFQEAYLFQGTLYNNIRIGRPDASREEVLAAAREAAAIRLSRGCRSGMKRWRGRAVRRCPAARNSA